MTPADTLVCGRDAHGRQQWTVAYESLAAADQETELSADDLWRLGEAAALTGNDDAVVTAWERAHHSLIDEERHADAARVAFWLGMMMFQWGQHAPASGWMGRAQRVLDDNQLDSVERGYLLAPQALRCLDSEPEQALTIFARMTAMADEHRDPDGMALGRLGQGQALVRMGRAADGISMLDEAMVEATSGRVSPLAAGVIYCAVIIYCQKVFDLRRAREWTFALSRWCDRQDGLHPYRGQCLVHRSEIMQLSGDWKAALTEVENACEHLAVTPTDPVMGMARYQQAELLRLRGQLGAAEEAYRLANDWGHPVQPGLALLRLAQGRPADAASSVRRVLDEAQDDRVRRSRVLAACVEIELATGNVPAARAAADELETVAGEFDTPYVHAVAAAARGAVVLSDDDPAAACATLRQASRLWQELEAPYEAACVRLHLVDAYRRLGDHDTADLELDAARRVFEQVGAPAALERVDDLVRPPEGHDVPGDLTAREVEVIRLVATGATNREVADELVISEKTVARHLSNIFTKLDISSRSAATAWAYEHGLA